MEVMETIGCLELRHLDVEVHLREMQIGAD